MKPEIYISTDVETDGPIPGPNSMLSFASVAFAADGLPHGTFERNLELLPGAQGDPATLKWWEGQPDAWAAHRKDLVAPESAMVDYANWLSLLPGRPVFVGYPAGFDFMFVYWYLIRFTGKSPFSFSAIDMKTFAFAILRQPYRSIGKKSMPKEWIPKTRAHTHRAIDDAWEQAQIFLNMIASNDARHEQAQRSIGLLA